DRECAIAADREERDRPCMRSQRIRRQHRHGPGGAAVLRRLRLRPDRAPTELHHTECVERILRIRNADGATGLPSRRTDPPVLPAEIEERAVDDGGQRERGTLERITRCKTFGRYLHTDAQCEL